MSKFAYLALVTLLSVQSARGDDMEVVCFFPEKINFNEINRTCSKGDLIRTRTNLAELVCDWDKQIFKYQEDEQEWVTCVYHGHARQLKVIE